jgi:hypothetical protein
VGGGLVTNLAHPGSNATGFSVQATDLVGKRLELLGEIFFPICGVLDTALNSDEAG